VPRLRRCRAAPFELDSASDGDPPGRNHARCRR
jgi:hypothetical protein